MRTISNDVIEKVQRGLERGESRNALMGKLNLSKTFVAKVARGEVVTQMRRSVSFGSEQIKDMQLFYRDYSLCKKCGCRVQKPCLKCVLESGDLKPLEDLIMPKLYEDTDNRCGTTAMEKL